MPPRFRSTSRCSPSTTARPALARATPVARRRLRRTLPVWRPAFPARSSSAPRRPTSTESISGRPASIMTSATRIAAISGFCATTDSNPRLPARSAPTFNEQSNQPQMRARFPRPTCSDANTVNQFNGSVLFYAAVFVPSDAERRAGGAAHVCRFCRQVAFSPVGALGEPVPDSSFRRAGAYSSIRSSDDLSHVAASTPSASASAGCTRPSPIWISQALGGPINGMIATDSDRLLQRRRTDTSLTQAFPSSPEQGIQIQYLRRLCCRRLEGERSLDRFLESAAGKLREPDLRYQLLLPAGEYFHRRR